MVIPKYRQILSYFLILVLVLFLFLGGIRMFAGQRPNDLGVQAGRLAACPQSPNCVSSQTIPSDREHYIQPIAFAGELPTAITQLKEVINSLPRTKIIAETNDYLYAEFTSKLMGFVDDVEFYLQPQDRLIQLRSASRLGESDLGVNRQRIEDIRSKFSEINR
jgi:uncharacterized protein (DUF1499 family)